MKKSNVFLVLLATLSLSGCSFSNNLSILKNWILNNIYNPVVSLLNHKEITDEYKEDAQQDDGYEKDESYIDIFDDDTNNNEKPIDDNSNQNNPPEGQTPDEVVLLSLSLNPPTKTTFEMGEEFDLTGLSVIGNYSDGTNKIIPLEDLELPYLNTYKLGEHTLTVKYQNKTASFVVNVIRTYNESPDSVEGIDTSDLSSLVNSFNQKIDNYTSKTISYFNSLGAYDYYRHYQKNYVQSKNNYLTSCSFYNYPYLEEYLGILNTGYLNKDNNYYSFSLNGDNVAERLAYSLTGDDLVLKKENSRYQDEMFTLSNLDSQYFAEHLFFRVSENKYECTEKEVLDNFVDICAPGLINQGAYMTFRKVTIEVNASNEIDYRIRLYATAGQTGKLIEDSLDQENKPNWYLLFSEALISDVGTTTFAPASSILN